MPEAGWLYVLEIPALPGVVKIGRTSRDPTLRCRELGGADCPLSWLSRGRNLCLMRKRPKSRRIGCWLPSGCDVQTGCLVMWLLPGPASFIGRMSRTSRRSLRSLLLLACARDLCCWRQLAQVGVSPFDQDGKGDANWQGIIGRLAGRPGLMRSWFL